MINSIFEKIKGDFFSIMGPGFSVFAFFSIFILSFIKIDGNQIQWGQIVDFIGSSIEYWPFYFVVFFIVYLIGSFIRAIPINAADRICKRLRPRYRKKSDFSSFFYKSSFPYRPALNRLLIDLNKSRCLKKSFKLPDDKNIYTAFNYYKSYLCINSPNAFEYTQTLESRVRLFAGMFWAGIFGVICSFVFCLFALFKFYDCTWLYLHFLITSFSLITIFLFGSQLPRMRGQEVEYVFYSYLALIHMR